MDPSRSLRLVHVINNCEGPNTIQYKYSQLSVSRTTDKSDFSISRTHLVGLVGFVSSSMLNYSDKSDKLDWISRNFL